MASLVLRSRRCTGHTHSEVTASQRWRRARSGRREKKGRGERDGENPAAEIGPKGGSRGKASQAQSPSAETSPDSPHSAHPADRLSHRRQAHRELGRGPARRPRDVLGAPGRPDGEGASIAQPRYFPSTRGEEEEEGRESMCVRSCAFVGSSARRSSVTPSRGRRFGGGRRNRRSGRRGGLQRAVSAPPRPGGGGGVEAGWRARRQRRRRTDEREMRKEREREREEHTRIRRIQPRKKIHPQKSPKFRARFAGRAKERDFEERVSSPAGGNPGPFPRADEGARGRPVRTGDGGNER